MTLIEATKTSFRQYATFSGRAARPEFWKFGLFLVMVSALLTLLNSVLFGPTVTDDVRVSINSSDEPQTIVSQRYEYNSAWFGAVFGIATITPLLAVSWRRLHDTGRLGWHIFLPVAGIAVMLGIFFVAAERVIVDATDLPSSVAVPESVLIPSNAILFLIAWLAAFSSFAVVIWWLARPTQTGPNKYGPNPYEVPQ
ncbi:MAG: DUF805 domain-containing protein [Pseudomonadota bacterium]